MEVASELAYNPDGTIAGPHAGTRMCQRQLQPREGHLLLTSSPVTVLLLSELGPFASQDRRHSR